MSHGSGQPPLCLVKHPQHLLWARPHRLADLGGSFPRIQCLQQPVVPMATMPPSAGRGRLWKAQQPQAMPPGL